MRLHLVQAGTGETEGVPPPAIDLSCGSTPEDLIEQYICLESRVPLDSTRSLIRFIRKWAYHVVVVASHL